MENPKWAASPDQSLLLRYGSHGLDEDEEEGEESKLDLTFDAIDADINLDESARSNSRPNALGGHMSSAGVTDITDGAKARKTIDRWSSTAGKPATMTLKEQEKIIDELNKQNFSLKLKVYFLEDRLAKLSPEHADQAAHENIELKVKLQTLLSELKQYKRLLMEAHAAIEALQAQKNCDLQHGMSEEEEEAYRNAIADALELRTAMKELAERIEALEQENHAKDLELAQLRSRLEELEDQAGNAEQLKDLTAKYEDQIRDLHEQLLRYQQNESRLPEKARVDDGWENRYRELEQELNASHQVRSELEQELSLMRSEKAAYEQDMNLQIEQHRDELSKARLDIAELSHQLEDEREQLRQVQDMHTNDMNALSDRWTLDRQQMRGQINDLNIDLEELRKMNDQLEAQLQDLMAWRNEDAARHDQELADLVGELEDKTAELIQLQEDLQSANGALQLREGKIMELEDRLEQMEMARREADAIHDEVITRMKSKMQPGSSANLAAESVSLHDFQMMREELALIEEQNRKLETQLRIEIDQRMASEKLQRGRHPNNYQQWDEERQQLERGYNERIDELQDKLAMASEEISQLANDLKDRDNDVRYYEEHLKRALRQSREVEERHEEMEYKLNSDLEATTAALLDIRQEVEQIKANRVEKNDLLHSRSNEVDRLNVKTRKLNVSVAALEEEKERLETALRDSAATIAMMKSRLKELELQVTQKQRDDDVLEESTKNDLTERNSLLLTVLQHLESILGGDSQLDSDMLPKPSANFVYFTNHLISRLKSLSKLFILFEKKGKELEDKSIGQMNQLKKQLDLKLKQLDRFETIVRTAADRQRKWREQLIKKQTENEELQSKLQQLTKTILELKAYAGSVSDSRAQDYEARCKHAERKLQLEKTRSMDAEERWNARLRELEKRTKEAEERVKRERQGAKERVAGLSRENENAQKTIDNLQRKNAQLQQLVDIHQKGKEESNGATGSSLYASEQLNRQNSASSLVRSATEVGLFKMNDQLRNELEQRSKATEKEREKTRSALRELDAANAQCYQLQQQLSQRENVIKNTLSRIELLSQRREIAESVALRQATEELYHLLDVDDAWD
ncbi:hypothetical protein BCR41DRAFT_351783 [Lobosporangium transversale]|uniref:Centrosomin N-terminal motif 1 domain-containing protein n=1 Tax=Lobosporangium transversale TaxID=64571 RepID=A0A1Y2GQQ9_9FUNG|nr:hypothetical protein BCR41DRAFT_351783 [Lobosporangium transversale]ORZ19225.1 hypothetical protein BCR41DRAFT_351783 [Lobosporangium transversale]|eukprot:XP_021882393.1 hypothetical protein BCR41DRAFT_351783 [Lobosporangium transversale]